MNIKRYFKFCITLLKFRFNRQLIYSFNFWTAFFVDLTVFFIQMLVFSTMFLQVDNINGWNRYQMIFFVGTFTILDSIYMCTYFFGVINIPDKVRTGKLDIYLTKPINTLFYLSFENMDFGSILLTVPGIMMLVYSTAKLNITVTLWSICGYILLILIMLLLMYDLMVIIRSASFWFTSISSLSLLENELVTFSFRIPGVVFKGISKLVFYVLLPYGLMATIPTEFFTEGFLGGKYWLMTICVCLFFTLFSQMLWKMGLKRYESASS